MNNILVYIEARAGKIQPISLELLSAARSLASTTGAQVEAAVFGAAPKTLASQLGAADRVLVTEDPALEAYTPEAHGAALLEIVRRRSPRAILFGYTTIGLDLAPALAQQADLPMIGYCRKVSITGDELDTTSLIYGGKIEAISHSPLPAVIALTPGAYPEAEVSTASENSIEILPPPALNSLRTRLIRETSPDVNAVDITQADKIVCVGRGIKDRESVALAEGVAGLLGAEIAGSRPIIDSGWLPKERQVGKSGRKVAPKLYFSVGVSGAPEHLEGMKGADLIVAVNTDAKAPIFDVAHFGAACDLFELLPALEQRLKSGGA